MYLYKCKTCGLLTNREFAVCPDCYTTEKPEFVSVRDLDGEIYKLTMDDVDCVIEQDIDEELALKLSKVPREEIRDVISRKLEIPWSEYIVSTLEEIYGDEY